MSQYSFRALTVHIGFSSSFIHCALVGTLAVAASWELSLLARCLELSSTSSSTKLLVELARLALHLQKDGDGGQFGQGDEAVGVQGALHPLLSTTCSSISSPSLPTLSTYHRTTPSYNLNLDI